MIVWHLETGGVSVLVQEDLLIESFHWIRKKKKGKKYLNKTSRHWIRNLSRFIRLFHHWSETKISVRDLNHRVNKRVHVVYAARQGSLGPKSGLWPGRGPKPKSSNWLTLTAQNHSLMCVKFIFISANAACHDTSSERSDRSPMKTTFKPEWDWNVDPTSTDPDICSRLPPKLRYTSQDATRDLPYVVIPRHCVTMYVSYRSDIIMLTSEIPDCDREKLQKNEPN